MTPRRQRQLLRSVSAALLLLAVLSLAWGLFWPVGPLPVPTTESVPAFADVSQETPRTAATGPAAHLSTLRKLAAWNWRRPLFPEPGSPEEDDALADGGSGLPLSLRLVGLVLEPGHSMALFQKPDGSIEVCPQGQSVDDTGGKVKVSRIETDRVTIVFQGQSQVLMLPQDAPRPTSATVGSAPATVGSTSPARRRLAPEVEKRLQELRAARGLPPLPAPGSSGTAVGGSASGTAPGTAGSTGEAGSSAVTAPVQAGHESAPSDPPQIPATLPSEPG